MAEFKCSFCAFLCANDDKLLKHYVRCYENAPSFIAYCTYAGYGASFKNYNSFKKHIKRNHFMENIPVPNDIHVNATNDYECEEMNNDFSLLKSEAFFY